MRIAFKSIEIRTIALCAHTAQVNFVCWNENLVGIGSHTGWSPFNNENNNKLHLKCKRIMYINIYRTWSNDVKSWKVINLM